MESSSEIEPSSRDAVPDWQLSSVLFRATQLNGVFVRRRGVLLSEVLATYHEPEDNAPPRMWPLTNECEIEPVMPATFTIAEDGWNPFVAKLLSKTYTIDGYVISLSWPNSRLMADTELILGFDTERVASEWRTALTNAIMGAQAVTRSAFQNQAGSSEMAPSDFQTFPSIDEDSQADAMNPNEIDPESLDKRNWTAIKELDDMVVYYQENETGGAYMVSQVIHADPKRALEALMTGSFLLCCGDVSLVRKEGDIEILHLVLQPVGLGNWLLTPRELLIERIWTQYNDGTQGVLFKSCDEHISTTPDEERPWWSWFTKPIEAYIPAAGFTVSPLAASPRSHWKDTLLTLVLKIDLGGVCASQHPMRPFVDALGLSQAWIDGILRTVSVLKATLEKEPELQKTSSLLSCASLKRASSLVREESFSLDARDSFIVRKDSLPLSNGVLNKKFWINPGSADFILRGVNYLTDKAKVPAAEPRFKLDWVYILRMKSPTPNVSRFLPALRSGERDFTFVMQVMLPGPPYLSMVIGWTTQEDISASTEGEMDPDPFKASFLRFLDAEDDVRDGMFKLIPKVVEGSWFVRRAVGSTPVIMGKKLKQYYHSGPGYFELDIDVASSRTASGVISIVRGATRSLTVDLAVLIQGDLQNELPESLIGTVRLNHVDMETAIALETIRVED